MECSVLRLGGGEYEEDAPHEETADAIDPIVPLLQHATRLPRSQHAECMARRRSFVDGQSFSNEEVAPTCRLVAGIRPSGPLSFCSLSESIRHYRGVVCRDWMFIPASECGCRIGLRQHSIVDACVEFGHDRAVVDYDHALFGRGVRGHNEQFGPLSQRR